MKKTLMFLTIPLLLTLTSCNKKILSADVVVFANSIYTSNKNCEFVEAFAIKDGKYLAIGSKKDISLYIDNNTRVYNANFVMPGAIESHGHWILDQAFKIGFYINPLTSDNQPKKYEQIVNEIIEYRKNNPTITAIYGYGPDVSVNGLPDLKLFDDAFPDIPIFISESSLHGAILNSKCFEVAGVLKEDKDGIPIDRDENGNVIGIARDEACTYIRNKIYGALLPSDLYQDAVKLAIKNLNSNGYVIHYDTWSNFDGTDEMYKAIHALDEKGELNAILASAYCIESYEKNKSSSMIDHAVNLKQQYESEHYKPNFLKLFADGIVEMGTGYMLEEYREKSLGHGTRIWEPTKMTEMVNEANSKGLLVHVHTMGDAAVREAVDAFIDSNKNNGYARNSIGHVAFIDKQELQKIKDNEIGVTSGANWSSQITNEDIETSSTLYSEDVLRNLYPYKEYIDMKIPAALHTDNPCSPGILDVFGYMQVMLNGIDHSKPTEGTFPRRSKFVTVKDVINMFTINGAWMNNLEKERGSIEVGKYADFIFGSENPFTQNINDVWNIQVTDTFFEGNRVYNINENN